MPKAVSKTTLELTKKEVLWLKSMVQNPIHYEDSRDEPEEEGEMRYSFWKALGDIQ